MSTFGSKLNRHEKCVEIYTIEHDGSISVQVFYVDTLSTVWLGNLDIKYKTG